VINIRDMYFFEDRMVESRLKGCEAMFNDQFYLYMHFVLVFCLYIFFSYASTFLILFNATSSIGVTNF